LGSTRKAALHRRERLAGRFDRAGTMPVEINADRVKDVVQKPPSTRFV
jgi:hypothetical protein